MSRSTYVFLDESGNLDFSAKGSRYFLLTSVSMRRPFSIYGPLDTYKHDCIEFGLDSEFFHCAHDNSHVRRAVFDRIAHYLDDMRIDILVVEKRKTLPALREDRRFYPQMLGYLLSPDAAARYGIPSPASRVTFTLWASSADYCSWAAFRKWEHGETAHIDRIRTAVRSEFEIFRTGATFYY